MPHRRDLIDLAWRAALAIGLVLMGADLARAAEPAELYQQHCAACHGAQRTGAMGPALLPESLERLRRPEASRVITQGRVATQMAAFHDKLSAPEIAALAEWIYTPVNPAGERNAESIVRRSENALIGPSRSGKAKSWSST